MHRVDEHQRLLLLVGLAVGFALAMIASLPVALLGTAGLALPAAGWIIYGVGMLGWAVAAVTAQRRMKAPEAPSAGTGFEQAPSMTSWADRGDSAHTPDLATFETAVELIGLSKSFCPVHAVRGIDLTVKRVASYFQTKHAQDLWGPPGISPQPGDDRWSGRRFLRRRWPTRRLVAGDRRTGVRRRPSLVVG